MTADADHLRASELLPEPPFTVDLLFELPESAERYEVLEGQLVVSPPAEPVHNLAHDRLRTVFDPLLPDNVESITNSAVRLPNGDGAVPDLLVTDVDPGAWPRGIPAEHVHTVVEVVSPSRPSIDRLTKKKLYAAAGIACYWRVELRPWRDHRAPLPAIVIRLLGDDGEWHETLHPAGTIAALPIVVGARGPEIVSVKLDPAWLVGPRRRAS
jgi:Uma2 family endonuclease